MTLIKDKFEVRKIQGTFIYMIGSKKELDEFAEKIKTLQ